MCNKITTPATVAAFIAAIGLTITLSASALDGKEVNASAKQILSTLFALATKNPASTLITFFLMSAAITYTFFTKPIATVYNGCAKKPEYTQLPAAPE